MNTHGPDDRLSAFYDGELSAAERADVERLVTERSDLRAELSAMAGLSQRLSDLADDVPEVDLRQRVMQRIAAVRPVPQRGVVPRDVTPRRHWTPLLWMACALTLVVVAALPWLPRSNETQIVANNAHPDSLGGEPAMPLSVAMNSPAMTPASPTEQFSTQDSPMTASSATSGDRENLGGSVGGTGLGGGSANRDGTGPSEFLARLERRRDLKPGDIVSHMVEDGDVPMIADYTVVDVNRTANHVEILLREHGIVPLTPMVENPQAPRRKPSAKISGTADMKVYLVDAESVSLNTALLECQNLKDVVALSVESLAPFDDAEGQRVSRGGGLPRKADTAPAGLAAPSMTNGAAADKRGAAGTPGSESKDRTAKFGPLDRKTKPAAEMPHPDSLTKKMSDESGGEQRLSPVINGNSLIVENGDELYSEIKYRQVQQSKTPGRGNYSIQKQQAVDTQPFTPPGQKTESAESVFVQGKAQPSAGNLMGDGLPYGNSLNTTGYLNRQRAVLVLRSQLPPPPPEPTRIHP